MTLKLYIGNPNYSSWSMRAGVLLRAFGIAHDEILIRIDGFDANSTFKTEVNRIGATGTVPFLIDTSVQDGHDQSLIITDTLSIVEYIAETFADHAIWPKDRAMRAKARNLCAEMHSGFGALRQHCMMNIGPDLSAPEHLFGAITPLCAAMSPGSRPHGLICWLCPAGRIWQVISAHWMPISRQL